MAFPSKTNYLSGDVLTAAQMNDIGSEINALNGTAGKNKLQNADFSINQRNFTSITADGYGFDRWKYITSSGTVTYSAQTFTAGTAPVAGYEAKNYARVVTSGQSGAGAFAVLIQAIESVRTLANQTATISFWAKAGSGTPKVTVELSQFFGTGGSPSSQVDTYAGQITLSTSWARYSLTVAVPSISGKTLGTANNDKLDLNLWLSAGTTFDSRTGSLGIQSATFDFWGVQVEAGNVATAFQTATGTLQGELAACQRYYYRQTAPDAYSNFGVGFATNTTASRITIVLPVPMRTKPSTTVESANLALYDGTNIHAPSSITIGENNTQTPSVNFAYGTATLTANRPYVAISNNSTAAYLGFSAEL